MKKLQKQNKVVEDRINNGSPPLDGKKENGDDFSSPSPAPPAPPPPKKKNHCRFVIPYSISLPLLVTLDMIGVALVVPLLSSRYYALAGVSSAVQREWLSSIFSISQIVGGLTIGALADSGLLSRHTILLLSFLGSAVAYFLITIQSSSGSSEEGSSSISISGLTIIVISRITVGLVKQTFTVTSSILARSTTATTNGERENERIATQMGRLSASVTVAWIVGPSAGAYLFSQVGTYAPVYVSCCLFLFNSLIVLFCLPPEQQQQQPKSRQKQQQQQEVTKPVKATSKSASSSPPAHRRILSNFQACFRSNNSCLTSAVSAQLLFQWASRTTTSKNISTYYETRYGTEPHQRGYLQSYQSFLAFVVQSLLIRPILHGLGGEVNAACVSSLVMAIVTMVELLGVSTFSQFLVLVCPLAGTALAVLGVSLKSIVSKVTPQESISSVFATVDVLQNMVLVTVPFYRTLLFRWTQPTTPSLLLATTETATAAANSGIANSTTALGDPDPNLWLLSSGLHWILATAAFSYLLLRNSPCAGSIGSTLRNNKSLEKTKTA